MKQALVVAVLFLLAAAPARAELNKYRSWLDSPEAYFLTDDERRQWRGVQDDQQATVFINRFFERRGGAAFRATIEHRTGLADKLFTFEKRRGSSTVRGKLLILFGMPIHIGASKLRRERRFQAAQAEIGSEGASGARVYRNHRLIFAANTLRAFGGEDYDVNIEVDQSTGEDRLAKGVNRKKLERLIDAAVAASMTKR